MIIGFVNDCKEVGGGGTFKAVLTKLTGAEEDGKLKDESVEYTSEESLGNGGWIGADWVIEMTGFGTEDKETTKS